MEEEIFKWPFEIKHTCHATVEEIGESGSGRRCGDWSNIPDNSMPFDPVDQTSHVLLQRMSKGQTIESLK